VFHSCWPAFLELIGEPFRHIESVWGIVPLYFALLLNEMTSTRANYRTAVQTGFSFLWAGAQWIYPYFRAHDPNGPRLDLDAMLPVNLMVTILVVLLGIVALISGLRRRFPKYGSFLGYTRFSNYFMISIFPIQAHYLSWTWLRLAAIGFFAVPVWLVLHFGLMPIRNRP
jgi:hypothetical protein